MLIQYICSHPSYWRLFLHTQNEDTPCCGDREDNIKMDLQEVGSGNMDWIWLRIGTGSRHV